MSASINFSITKILDNAFRVLICCALFLPTNNSFLIVPKRGTQQSHPCKSSLTCRPFVVSAISPLHLNNDDDDQITNDIRSIAVKDNSFVNSDDSHSSWMKEIQEGSDEFRRVFMTTISSVIVALALSVSTPDKANAVLGAGSAVVNSPAVVKKITLEDYLSLPEKKQRQYEGGFLTCSKNSKKCNPTNLIDELLKEIETLSDTNPTRANELQSTVQNLLSRQRMADRQVMEGKLAVQPKYIYFSCAFFASIVATSIMHPVDTIKVRLMGSKNDESEDSDSSFNFLSLYDGLVPNLAKEAPASALYLGIYEVAKGFLLTNPFFQQQILLTYLISGSVGELVGSVVRSPAEAIKTRVQAGLFDVPGAVNNVLFTSEGRKNTLAAWGAGVFRDVPHGAVLLATFELTKTFIVDSPIDIDVNSLQAEALLGALGGGLGALISTPFDVVTTKIIVSIEEGGDPPTALEVISETWNESGISGFFSGVSVRCLFKIFKIFYDCRNSFLHQALTLAFSTFSHGSGTCFLLGFSLWYLFGRILQLSSNCLESLLAEKSFEC